jgi:HTH-type transcriptional regulator/antitoxin HigA
MKIQPVRTEAEHEAAVARIARLMGAEQGTAASDELEILATLVDAYEAKHFPMNLPDPVTILKFQMEQQGLTRKDLEPMIGSRARVSEILTGKRSLTLPMIRRLHTELGIPVDLLICAHPASPRSSRQNRSTRPIQASRTTQAFSAQQMAR